MDTVDGDEFLAERDAMFIDRDHHECGGREGFGQTCDVEKGIMLDVGGGDGAVW